MTFMGTSFQSIGKKISPSLIIGHMKPQERVLPIEKIIKLMIDCFVRGGNVLLNVAPNPGTGNTCKPS